METAERQHAKRMEQILASIDKKLERIAKSLEKMEPTRYELKYALPRRAGISLDVSDTTKPMEEEASESSTPNYFRDCLSDMFKP